MKVVINNHTFNIIEYCGDYVLLFSDTTGSRFWYKYVGCIQFKHLNEKQNNPSL